MSKNQLKQVTGEEKQGQFRTLSNGATYDMEKKKIVAGAVLTSDRAREMVRAREEKRIRLYNIGAQRAVQDTQLIREFGDDAHLVERAMTLQILATSPDAGKAAVMADSELRKAQGYEIPKGLPAGDAGDGVPRDLAAFAADVLAAAVASGALAIPPDAVDGTVIEPDAGDDVGDEEGEG